MKRLLSSGIIVMALISIVMVSCSRKEKGRFYSDQYHFSIVFPRTWEIQQKEMGTVVIGLSPEEGLKDDFRENITITTEYAGDDVTLEKYFEISQKNMKSYSTDYRLLYKNYTWLAKKKAMILGFTYSMSGLKLKALQYYIINNNRAYVITCTGLPHTFGRYEERFLTIVRSFRFEK
ncbi:MAG TPA: PsbP-related protein [Spirochaetota bacterium]|nr:PsbP-related protein [Spirochaetota bacterium]